MKQNVKCSSVFNFPVNTGVPFTQNTKSVTEETTLTSLHAGTRVGGVMWAEVKYYLSSRTGQPALLSRVPPPPTHTHTTSKSTEVNITTATPAQLIALVKNTYQKTSFKICKCEFVFFLLTVTLLIFVLIEQKYVHD